MTFSVQPTGHTLQSLATLEAAGEALVGTLAGAGNQPGATASASLFLSSLSHPHAVPGLCPGALAHKAKGLTHKP